MLRQDGERPAYREPGDDHIDDDASASRARSLPPSPKESAARC